MDITKIQPLKKIEKIGKRIYETDFDIIYKQCGNENIVVAYIDYLDYQILRHIPNGDVFNTTNFESSKLKKYILLGYYIVPISMAL